MIDLTRAGLIVAAVPGKERNHDHHQISGRVVGPGSSREPVVPADARSGAVFERIVVGPDRYFVKRLSMASDWIMRASGDRVYRQHLVWRAAIMDQSPECIDHTVVAMSVDGEGEDAVLTIVMRDIGGLLVPPGDAILPAGQHARFIAHMAALSASFWDWDDQIGLTTMAQRIRFFAPDHHCRRAHHIQGAAGGRRGRGGLGELPARSPLLSQLARLVHDQPEVLLD